MKLIIVGAGGHFRSVYDSLDKSLYESIVILDKDNKKWGKSINGVKVIGDIKCVKKLIEEGYDYCFVAIGDNSIRRKYTEIFIKNKLKFINIIDKSAIISKQSSIGVGNYIGKNVIINTEAIIGDYCVLNNMSLIEHDCVIDNFSFVSPAAVMTGGVKLNMMSFIGTGTVINPYLTIGKNTTIGSNSTVTKNIEDNAVAYGTPCEVIKWKI